MDQISSFQRVTCPHLRVLGFLDVESASLVGIHSKGDALTQYGTGFRNLSVRKLFQGTVLSSLKMKWGEKDGKTRRCEKNSRVMILKRGGWDSALPSCQQVAAQGRFIRCGCAYVGISFISFEPGKPALTKPPSAVSLSATKSKQMPTHARGNSSRQYSVFAVFILSRAVYI